MRLPRKFGKYVLLKPLARGGMGEIYLAASGEIGGFEKLCVIKKVLSEKTDRSKANRFQDEAKVVLRLSHANLVPTFDAGEVEDEFYIAMELVEGKDLREVWNRCVRTRTRIPLDVALHVGREIARALSYVHTYADLNLVHRDVAPPNILLSYFGEVKLTDFGLARSVLKQEHTAPGVVFGRASYLAPEQVRGELADARTDIYSLGIVLWELLTGHQYLQLGNLDPATAMALVRNPRPQPPSVHAPWLSPELDAVVLRALSPNRELRFQTAEELRQALSDIITQIAPRADAERAAEFLRALYGSVIKDEQEERARLLAAAAETRDAPDDEEEREAGEPRTDGPTRVWKRPPEAADPGRAAAMIGRVIDGRYRITRKLGEGGMGTVYAAEHVEIGKTVAIKVLHPVYSHQQDLVERFRREARAASRIGHPNIIDVTDFGNTEDGCFYFVMEHLDGIDLADVLAHERRVEPARAAQIAVQICRALQAAHSAGVIHRDLKPENIFLVARDGQADFVKVLDFGIARSLTTHGSRRLTNPGMAMGTPEYMAPEQARGRAADGRADIYSVGALIYEMVIGTPPSPQLHSNDELVPPRQIRSEIPEELEAVILRALQVEPEKRPQTMAQLEFELTKSMWGRDQAVAELLGLRQLPSMAVAPAGAERNGAEGLSAGTNGAGAAAAAAALREVERAIDRLPAPTRVSEPGPGPAVASGSSPVRVPDALDVVTRRTRSSMPRVPALAFEPTALSPVAAPSDAGSVASTLARVATAMLVLGAAIVASATVYRHASWLRGDARTAGKGVAALSAPRPSPAEARAARLRALRADARAKVATLTPAGVAALEQTLAHLRREGATAEAAELAASGSATLRGQAMAELDAGQIEPGMATFKAALTLATAPNPSDSMARELSRRARLALAAKRNDQALRWAREANALAPADADVLSALAEALDAAGERGAAVQAYERALAGRPEDDRIRKALGRARQRLRATAPVPRQAARPAARAGASPTSPAGPAADVAPAAAPEAVLLDMDSDERAPAASAAPEARSGPAPSPAASPAPEAGVAPSAAAPAEPPASPAGETRRDE